MTPSLDLSILIVNWNSKEFLRKCLVSVYRETHGLEFEVIVVDNASFDGSKEIVAAEFPQVRFVQSDTNLGFARANNLAFEHSLGRVVFLLNPDTEIISDAIPRMFIALGNLKDAGIVGCKLLNSDLSVQTPCIKRFPTILTEALSSEWLRLKFPSFKLWSLDPLFSQSPDPVRVDAVCGACQMIPREVYEAVGGLNTEYFMYAEDVEISAAALVKGWKTYYVGTATIIHHGGKSSQGHGRGERWISIMQREAQWQFYRTWRGTVYAVLFRITIGFVSLMRAFSIAILSPILFLLRGKKDVLRAWRRWSGGLLWSLGFEGLTSKFRGQLTERHSAPEETTGEASLHSDNDSSTQELAAHREASEAQHRCRPAAYVLMTAAYNEEAQIEKTIESVLSQTRLPKRWVIVSDGSLDRTDEIVQSYARKHDFIRFWRVTRAPGRSFASKVVALRSASELLEDVKFDFIGNLDADISVDSSYFEDLIAHFEIDPKLGIASGFVSDRKGKSYESNTTNRVYSVAHGAQLVRRECYEAIGGYAVLKYGGEDWHAQVSAMMNGWTAEAFGELNMLHHRPTGDADNLLRYRFREGRMDYSFGSDPLFEAFKCLQRIVERPYFSGGMARLAGFAWSWICGDPRAVSSEFIAFLRKDQRGRLKRLLRWTSLFSVRTHRVKSN
jgi:GT2 family glycosyltransferase